MNNYKQIIFDLPKLKYIKFTAMRTRTKDILNEPHPQKRILKNAFTSDLTLFYLTRTYSPKLSA